MLTDRTCDLVISYASYGHFHVKLALINLEIWFQVAESNGSTVSSPIVVLGFGIPMCFGWKIDLKWSHANLMCPFGAYEYLYDI